MASRLPVLGALLIITGILVTSAEAATIECACSTEDCKREMKFSCTTKNICYVQYLATTRMDDDREAIERGCIDESTPLLCENRRPQKLRAHAPWPILYCCNDKDFCNQNVLPTIPTYIKEGMQRLNLTGRRNPPPPIIPVEPFHKSGPKVEKLPRQNAPTLCSDNSEQPMPVLHTQSSGSPHRTINPIYIAVPLAGVCVLLALIIFAMYLLKRRNTYYDHYPYHTHVSTLHPHCHVDPKRTVPKMNRCTDSERSSSGSESKLFIQA
ncbi:uncharacterized protein LOC135477627 [Liolophura sinensis]|uniref:uncharacterized protein LOC135477627 n=1 Tax=Liolophura sinensis TaxID=3198878 RepID=UPI003158FF18